MPAGVYRERSRRAGMTDLPRERHAPMPSVSFDHLIRPPEQFVWDRMTDLFCRLEVNDEFKLHRLLYRQVARFRSLEDSVYVVGGVAEQVSGVHPVGHQTALIDILLLWVNSRQLVFAGKLDAPLS